MRKISSALSGIFGWCRPAVSLNILLKSSWGDIVGEDLRDITALDEAKYIGANKISVCIKVLSSAAVLARNAEKNIIYAIERLVSIHEILLTFRQSCAVDLGKEDTIKAVEMLPARSKKQQKIEKQFESSELKTALEALKTEIV